VDINLEFLSIPAISLIVYILIEVIKYTVNQNEKFKKIIPLVSTLLGGALGIVAFYLAPDILPSDNLIVALVIGIASGLTATGTNQIFKQLKK